MSNRKGPNSILAFITGALAVAVVGLGYLAYTDQPPFGPDEASITIELPDLDVKGAG